MTPAKLNVYPSEKVRENGLSEEEKQEILNKIAELEEQYRKLKNGEIKAQPNVECYTRIVGYFSRKTAFNPGKLEEVNERVPFDLKDMK